MRHLAEELEAVDTDPEEWGPEHDEIRLTPEEEAEGNRQGREIDPDDDYDNGLNED